MPSRHRRRGRVPIGGRGFRPGGVFFAELRRLVQELLDQDYTAEDIVRYFVPEYVGPSSPPEPEPKPERPVLKVTGVDFVVDINTREHRTDEYDIVDESSDPALVVRRGQPFRILVQFSQPSSAKTHDLRLVFEIGSQPTESKGTRAAFLLSGKDKEGKWGASVIKTPGEAVAISVVTPPDCIVGKWRLSLEVVKKGEPKPVSRYTQEKPIYVLFNPWCKEDVVYYDNDEDLEDYVMDDSGCIFTGNSWYSRARPWEFGQFSGNVLDCSLYLLDSSDLKMQVRGDPIKVVRKLSAVVNSFDEGVLMGNWSGDYDDGTSPSEWTGSAAILEEYYSTKEPVKYGQCWVFSGVLTTVCRALGIPCRSVTNFDSAHDTDCSVTIDVHVDKDMKEMKGMNSDSIWNFHVWNEAWMRRDDLPEGYGGWQACDATPQESSEGVYQCGPCPLRAIKQGELTTPYDAPFIFAEVNADRVFWQWNDEDGKFKPVDYKERAVGHNLSTRALRRVRESDTPGWDKEREVVTKLYKYPEGSQQERAAVLKAYRVVDPKRSEAYKIGPQDVQFKLDFNAKTPVGQDFKVELMCQNQSKEERTIEGRGAINTMYYTGIVAEEVSDQKFETLKLAPNETKALQLTVTADQYTDQLKDGCFLYFTMSALVTETKQSAIKTDTIMMAKPELSIKAPKQTQIKEEFEVTVTFTNPLPRQLTACKLNVEGPRITKPATHLQSEVAANGTFVATLKLKPTKKGKRHIMFVFCSKQLSDITAEHKMQVQE